MRVHPLKIAPEHASSIEAARGALNAVLGKPTTADQRDAQWTGYADALEAAGLPRAPDWRDWPADTTRRPPAEPRRDIEEGR